MTDALLDFRYTVTRVLARVREARLPAAASALAFTTLLSLVPLVTVSLSILSMFPFFAEWRDDVEQMLYTNLVPATGDVVRSYLQEFAGQAGQLTGLGLVVLVVTALLLLSEIENALNTIWGMHKGRTFSQRVLLYWAMLTLGPVLLVVSLALTTSLSAFAIAEWLPNEGGAAAGIIGSLPILLEAVGFLLLYMIVPSRSVPFRFALIGAVIAVGLFELAKFGFVIFISNFGTYQLIYGALWTIPVFLIWIYLSWLVTLLGACVSAELASTKKAPVPPPRVRPVIGGKARTEEKP